MHSVSGYLFDSDNHDQHLTFSATVASDDTIHVVYELNGSGRQAMTIPPEDQLHFPIRQLLTSLLGQATEDDALPASASAETR